ncbi:GIY-YIG nuclease family protein [Agromyces sp. MMS24-JH15]|uniref:GIY-YIG nuclease family protein n=1 Tax=Agromyces sp. MMS24-JH15 TaxID=3243765 RepID=UPI003749BDF1
MERAHAIGCEAGLAAGHPCGAPAEPDAPIALCTTHLLVAHEWVDRTLGVTDLLPGPCPACGSRLGVQYPSGWLCAACEWRYGDLADPGLPPPRVDVVYYLRLGDRVKIGTSSNPRQRFTALPHDEVLAFERGDRRLEQRRHAQFAAHRILDGEWFHLVDELRAHADAVAGGVDPWDAWDRWVSEAIARRG